MIVCDSCVDSKVKASIKLRISKENKTLHDMDLCCNCYSNLKLTR